MTGGLRAPAPYCEFYVNQARFAFQVIARGKLDAFLWEGWREGLEAVVEDYRF